MVQPDEVSSRTFDSLPPRPPTPPRDSQHHANSRPSLFNRIFAKSLGAQTPPNLSPGSAVGATSSPSERANRRVAWSASTDYRDHEEPPKNPNGINPNLRLIPSSADRQLPPKSILKQNNGDAVNRRIDFYIQPNAHTPETFATMLESVTKQLAGDDRLSRIDAYMSLSDVLKATDSIPDEEALSNKMGLLTQFMQRDMTAKEADGKADKVLINNSLKLLASLLWKNEQFTQEFAVFVLEHTITSFENVSIPKDVVKHLLFIIGQQNFSPKIVTTDRASRLLNATYFIQQQYVGKSIALGRLSVYKKLLQQAKPVMLSNTLWMRHVFEDMLNPVKDVRIPVIAFGLEAALQLGTEKHGTRAFTELFESMYDEKTKYADHYHGRLLRMLQSKSENASLEKACVPRIWTVAILFLRYKPAQLDKWEFWASYLHVLQKCFNSSDQEVKAQANLAWNRLVFALQPDETTEKRRLSRQLLQPFLGQLHAKRKLAGKSSKEALQITVSSACNLLYYALRPSASPTAIDQLWDMYVPPLIQQLSDTDSTEEAKSGNPSYEGSNQAIAILHALLNPTQRVKQAWRVDRAMSDERMRFDELPSLDAKWVRANSPRVLAVLQSLLQRRFRDLSNEESRLKDLWKGFLLAIAAAGSKEIITSHETMNCLAHIYTSVHSFWQQRPCHDIITQEGQSTAFLDGFVYLLTEMVNVLGMLPFGEKRLSIDDLSPFAVVATPSTNSRKTPKAAKTPVQCLVALLVAPGPKIDASFALKGALRRLLLPFYEFRVKNKTSLEFCQELLQSLPAPDLESNRGATEAIWCVLAKFVETTLESHVETGRYSSSGSSNNGSQLLGVTFRDRVRILEYGLMCLRYDALPEWQALYRRISWDVLAEVGHGGHALCMAEPLARLLREQYRAEEARSFVAACAAILEEAAYPASEQSLEAARRKLWGASTTATKPSVDPFKHIYSTMNFVLENSYGLEGASAEVIQLLETTTNFMNGCPDSVRDVILQAVGDGLSVWIRDNDDVMHSADSHSSLKESIQKLWRAVQSNISHLGSSNDLTKVKTIICAALSSRHRFIVGSTIELWNNSFGLLEDLQYPDEVANALARLRSSADLLLPNFPEIADNEKPAAAISFMDSDDSEPLEYASTSGPRGRSLTPSVLGSSPFKSRSSPGVTLGLPRSSINHQLLEVPGSARKRKVVKPDTTPRLRHDNSQIKFAAIEASPEPADAESQLLTEHQREIKERQQEENAAMFADLRSSPKPKSKKTEKKRLSLTSDRPVSQASEQEKPATPSVTSALRTLDDWVTSSPTPQSRKQKQIPVEIDLTTVEDEPEPEDIPSSPPKPASRVCGTGAGSPPGSPHANCCRKPAENTNMGGAKSKMMEVPLLQPPSQADVECPPSFANFVDQLAAEPVTNSSPAALSTNLRQLTQAAKPPRRRSPVKLSPRTGPEDDEDEVMEEAPPIALSSPTILEYPAPQIEKEVATSTKSKKRSRSKSSKSRQKPQELQMEAAVVLEQAPPSAQEERRRSSSLSELDEKMVKSLEAHHSIADDAELGYIDLKANANFSPEQYTKVEVFSSPQKSPEPDAPRKETRILPPKKSTAKGKTVVKTRDATSSPVVSGRTTRGAEKRKSMTPSIETPVVTPQRASSRLRHVEPPEVIDLEAVDPSLKKSSSKLSKAQRKAAYIESMKTPAAKAHNAKVVEETPAPAETPKSKSHKKKLAEPETQSSPSMLETWLRKETPVPVPSRKRKSSAQDQGAQSAEPAEQTPTVDTKSARNKRRKKDAKRLQIQVVEDSQQDQPTHVEHEGITVPPLSQSNEKTEKSGSSSTYRTANSTGSPASPKENQEAIAAQKKKKQRSKKGKGISAADRYVVESSQREEEERVARMLKEQQDELMQDVKGEPEITPKAIDDDAVSVVSSHLEVEDTADTTTVRYFDRQGRMQRELSTSKSPSTSQSNSASPNLPTTTPIALPVDGHPLTKSELDKLRLFEQHNFPPTVKDDIRRLADETDAQYNSRMRRTLVSMKQALRAHNAERNALRVEAEARAAQKAAAADPDTDMVDADVEAQLRPSIVSTAAAEPPTPARATTSSSDVSSTPVQQQGESSPLHFSEANHRVISSSPPAQPEKSSSEPSSQQQQQFTSSPPPQLAQEEVRVLKVAKESRTKGEVDSEKIVEDEDEDSSDDEDESDEDDDSSSPMTAAQPRDTHQAAHSALQEVQMVQQAAQVVQPIAPAEEQSAQPSKTSSSSSLPSEVAEDLTYENIQAVFAHGIEMLNRCNKGIRRHHVAKMEEMVFDIKGAMYNAERRSRQAMTEKERREEWRRSVGEALEPEEV